MNILEKHFPNLLALANSTETNPMQILRTCANAIVEASEIATHLQSIRDEITALKDQVASADKAWTEALASRDRAVDQVDCLNNDLQQIRAGHDEVVKQLRNDLETVNGQRLHAEERALEFEANCGVAHSALTEALADLSLARADLVRVAHDWNDAEARIATLTADRTSKDSVILDLIRQRDAALADLRQMEQYRDLAVEKFNLVASYEDKFNALKDKLHAIEDILTA